MIKKIISKRIIICSITMFALLLLTLFPKNKDNILDNLEIQIQYKDDNLLESIYLLNDYNLLSLTNVICNTNNIIEKASHLINVLIKGGIGEDKIPSGFKSIIPSDTKIIDISYDNKSIKINFSKELLDVSQELEEKVIEAIVYTLTSIKDVENVIIYIENDILNYLPKSKKYISTNLTRKFGINKMYDISSIHNINDVTIYYTSKYNDNVYYVPVTMYVNSDIEKIRVIVSELSSSSLYQTNLMSYLNSNTELLNIEEVDNILRLEFNDYIFNDIDTKNILEEVLYTISLSVFDNYDVDGFTIVVDNEEIYKKVLKTS